MTDKPFAQYKPEQMYCPRRQVSMQEGRQRYVAQFAGERLCGVFAVDQTLVKGERVCDKMMLFCDGTCRWHQVFVELKGTHVTYGVKQLQAAMGDERFVDQLVGRRHARIVGRNIPANGANSDIERARKWFAKRHVSFIILNSGRPDRFED